MKNFQQYAQLRESEENKNPSEKKTLNAKITLGEGNDYEPFFVSDDPSSEHYGKNKGLAPVIRAFKKGANWGWSKDPKDGSDKPVKIGSKKLYLTGGAVRDHLAGRTPRNIELATDASPDEIFHILKQNEFSFVDSDKSNKGQTFSIKTKDKNGRPFSYNINVDGNVYELEVFTKTPKGSEEPEPGTHADDASGRDFTLNAMSILLSSDNGPNKELNDFYGGLHHMASKKIQPIGDMKDSFSKDPKKIVRFARMVGNYGDIDSISGDEKNTIKSLITLLKKLKPEEITDEFKKGIKKDDVDSRKYLKTFGDLGLLNFVFPEQTVGESFPKELSELGDKDMSIAYCLRNNSPEKLQNLNLEPSDTNKIVLLVRSLGFDENIDQQGLQELVTDYLRSGISARKLKEWITTFGKAKEHVVEAFIQYARSPRVRVYINSSEGEKVNENFKDLFDPFTNQPIDLNLIEERKKEIEYKNFLKQLKG